MRIHFSIITWIGSLSLVRLSLFLLGGRKFGAWMNFDVWIIFSCLGASWLASLLMVGYILLHVTTNLMLFLLLLCRMHWWWYFHYTRANCCKHLLRNSGILFLYSISLCMGHVCWTSSPRDNYMVEFILTSHPILQNKV